MTNQYKKPKDYTFILIAIVLVIAMAASGGISYFMGKIAGALENLSSTPTVECRFEGAECPNVQQYMRDYQVELHLDTLWIWDKDRLVGVHVDTIDGGFRHGIAFDTILMKDNY